MQEGDVVRTKRPMIITIPNINLPKGSVGVITEIREDGMFVVEFNKSPYAIAFYKSEICLKEKDRSRAV